MTDRIETKRLDLFPYTKENLALFNADLSRFERPTAFFTGARSLTIRLADRLEKPKDEWKNGVSSKKTFCTE